MGDVSDVDLQFVVAVFELADMNGVVEIARGFAIDGDYGKLAVVAALAQGVVGNFGFAGRLDRLGFFDHFGREAVGQVKLADHDLDIDSKVVFFAENFDHAAARLLRGAGPVGDFHVDYCAFQILPVGVNFGFFAYDSILRLSALCPLCSLWLPSCVNFKSNHRGHRGHRGRRILQAWRN